MSSLIARVGDRAMRARTPLQVQVDLTYRCNERCVHCYLVHEDRGELTTDEFKTVLAQMRSAGTLFVVFSGGEILLRNDLFELIEHAKSLHMDVTLKTNGLLLDEEKARRLKELGVRKVQVSIYSADAAIHDRITQVRGSLQRSLAALRLIKDSGMVAVMACPLMTGNIAGYRDVLRLSEEMGMAVKFDATITPSMNGDLGLLALRQTADELMCVLEDRMLNPPKAAVRERPAEPGPDVDYPCSAGRNSAYVSPCGDVFPCAQLPLVAGNVRQQSFGEIWNRASALKNLRQVRNSEVSICAECSIRAHCSRCPGLALVEDGEMNGPSARACELAEAKARIAGYADPLSAYHRILRASGKTLSSFAGARPKLVTITPVANT